MNAPSSDMEGDSRPSGLAPDIGADEFFDTDEDGLPDWWETQHFGGDVADPFADDDGDGLSNIEECARDYPPLHPTPSTVYVNAFSGDHAWDGTSPTHSGGAVGPKAAVQAGIEAAQDGDIVKVFPGIYRENVDFRGKRIHVLAPFGPERTVIDASSSGRGVTFASKETGESVIEGFGITGGAAEKGGGILCEIASPTISDCHIYGNKTSPGSYACGAGIHCYAAAPAISDCQIYDNSTEDDEYVRGGGIYAYSSSLQIARCTIARNFSGGDGGGLFLRGNAIAVSDCDIKDNVAGNGCGGGIGCESLELLTISNCAIRGNRAAWGGGVSFFDCPLTTLSNSVIADNFSAGSGGGITCGGFSPLISGCLIFNNTAADEGGGAYSNYSEPRFINCTVVGNKAGQGGDGLGFGECTVCVPVVSNCILWNNGDDLKGCSATYSCIEDEDEGEGVTHDNPLFVCPGKEDFHLRPDSPCVDAGTSDIYFDGLPSLDMDGEHRPFATVLDIGADEYIDQDEDDLPDYWEIRWFADLWRSKEDDSDDDGLPNTGEFILLCDPRSPDTDADGQRDGAELLAGTDPLDAGSRFEILSVGLADGRLKIECSAVARRAYRLLVSNDLMEWIPFAGPFTAVGDTLSFADTTFLTSPRFYKVEVLP